MRLDVVVADDDLESAVSRAIDLGGDAIGYWNTAFVGAYLKSSLFRIFPILGALLSVRLRWRRGGWSTCRVIFLLFHHGEP